jgi:hypothetical protein
MRSRLLSAALLVAALAGATGGLAAPLPKEKEEKGKTDPAGVPLELKIVAKKTSYALALGGRSPAEFRKLLEDAKDVGPWPSAPAVDLVVELRNTGKSDLPVKVGGDLNVLTLTLTGKGAVNMPLRVPLTTIYYGPRTLTLAPGKSFSLPVKTLSSGLRGVTRRSWWTEPGDYQLVASYRTAVSPQPEGSRKEADGWGIVTVTSAPLALRVTAK